jgi:hypothetical protein
VSDDARDRTPPLVKRVLPASETPALAPLFDAIRRGTKRSKLRQLAIVCPEEEEGHVLVEVFPTAAGSYAVWKQKGITQTPESRRAWRGIFRGRPELRWLAVPVEVDQLLGGFCRHEGHEVTTAEIRAHLAAGRRRVVLRGGPQRLD